MLRSIVERRHAGEFMMKEEALISREVVVIAAGSGEVEAGTLIGKITATSKWAPSPDAEVEGIEGAEVTRGILFGPVDASTEDVKAVAVVRSAAVNRHCLEFHTSVDTDVKRETKLEELRAIGIIPR